MSDPLVVPKEVIQWMREFVDRSDHLVTMPTPKTTLVDRMLRAYGKEFYGECWPGDSLHVDQLDAMAAALAVVRAAVNDIPYEGADDRFDPVLELLGGGDNG